MHLSCILCISVVNFLHKLYVWRAFKRSPYWAVRTDSSAMSGFNLTDLNGDNFNQNKKEEIAGISGLVWIFAS